MNLVLPAVNQVAGVNYKVKIDVGGGAFVHAKIFKPLPHTGGAPAVSEASGGHHAGDAL
jgi:hypothetical protein